MDSITFIINYDLFLQEIKDVVKPELFPVLEELSQIDPHDLVTPETWFQSENDARGFIWSMFIKRIRKFTQQTNQD